MAGLQVLGTRCLKWSQRGRTAQRAVDEKGGGDTVEKIIMADRPFVKSIAATSGGSFPTLVFAQNKHDGQESVLSPTCLFDSLYTVVSPN